MHTRIIAGLVIGTSLTISSVVFGGCSGNAHLENPFGTDQPVSTQDGCAYVYENSFTNEGTLYQEKAPDGTPCQGNLGSCQSGICVARNDMDGSTQEIDGGTDAENPPDCDMESAECAPTECHNVVCENGTCTQMPLSEGDCEISTGASGTQNGICFQGECKECTETDVSKCPTPNNAYCDNFECKVCNISDCGKGTCAACIGQPCKLPTDCAEGSCIDSVCCKTECSGLCMTCNGASPGTCTPVEDGNQDSCPSGSYCFPKISGSGKRCYLQAGEICGADVNCMSKTCLMPLNELWRCSKSEGGEYCASDGDCSSGNCNDHRCAP